MKYNSKSYKIFKIINISIMIIIIISTVYPYLNELLKSLSEKTYGMLGGISFIPDKISFVNYETLFKSKSIKNAFFVSIGRTVLGTVLGVIVQFMAAYGLRKEMLRWRRALLLFLIIPVYFNGGLIPTYILYSRLTLLNNFFVYIIPGLFSYFNMIIIMANMRSIPDSLIDSAKLDGAGEFTVLWRIVFPLSKPILATITLWLAVGHWNDWVTTLMFTTSPRLSTLQYIVMQMIKESERMEKMIQEAIKLGINPQVKVKTTRDSLRAAQIITTTLPIILIYPFLQKHFIKGVMVGAIKT